MPEYTVWTNATEQKTIRAHGPREAASKYHQQVGEMPKNWDMTLYVRDENGEEVTYRHRAQAA